MTIDRDALARVIAQAFYCDPLDPAEMDPDDLAAALRAGGEAADGVLREWPHLAATQPPDTGLRKVAAAAVNHAADLLRQSRPGDAYDNIDPGPPLRDIARRFAAGEFDATFAAAPDPGPDQGDCRQHKHSPSYGRTEKCLTCGRFRYPARAREAEVVDLPLPPPPTHQYRYGTVTPESARVSPAEVRRFLDAPAREAEGATE